LNLITCIAIDDEPKALEIITSHCRHIPFLDLKAGFRDPLEAISYMKEQEVKLIFLDINMPRITGLQFLNLLKHQPLIIFTTAYSEYAIESYEYEAVDYLLKPFAFDRFLKAATKAFDRLESARPKLPESSPPEEKAHQQFIYLKSGPKLHKLGFEEILYVEKDGNYLMFNTRDKKILSRQNMKNIFQILPERSFLRVHRSFVINLGLISTIESHQVTIGDITIPLSSQYRDDLMGRVSGAD
jgi:DNA-binding LytR/AlgR family response regulator